MGIEKLFESFAVYATTVSAFGVGMYFTCAALHFLHGDKFMKDPYQKGSSQIYLPVESPDYLRRFYKSLDPHSFDFKPF